MLYSFSHVFVLQLASYVCYITLVNDTLDMSVSDMSLMWIDATDQRQFICWQLDLVSLASFRSLLEHVLSVVRVKTGFLGTLLMDYRV